MATTDSTVIRNHAAFIWSVADLLRGDYKQSEYGKVILPLTMIRRLDCVLERTKEQVLSRYESDQRVKEVAGSMDRVHRWRACLYRKGATSTPPFIRTATGT